MLFKKRLCGMGPHWLDLVGIHVKKKTVQAFSRRLCVAGSAPACRLITPGHVQTQTCSSGSHKGTGQRVCRNLSVHMGGGPLRRVCNVEATTRLSESRVIHAKYMMTVPLKCQSARPASQFIEVLSVVFQCVHLKHVHSYDTQLAAR